MTRPAILLSGLLAATGPVSADEVSLVRVGETWRFIAGTNEPSNPIPEWREAGFDDTAWSQGRSGFSRFMDEATWLSQPAPFRSAYFRKEFSVRDPDAIQWLVLRVDYVGGLVAYLNGVEIARRGLEGDPVPYDAFSGYHARAATEEIDVSAYRLILRPGENVLAIQAHAWSNSPSVLVLVPELLANFQRGPFVTIPATNSIQVVWKTPVAADSAVDFGTTLALGATVSDPSMDTNHAITLAGLTPDTLYYYRVRSRPIGIQAESPIYSFRTAKMFGSLSFAVLGDSGGGYAAQFNVAETLANLDPDLVLHAGDLIYPFFQLGYADTRLMSVYGGHMRTTPYFATFGNHELYGGNDVPYIDTLHLPTNDATGTEHFYSFDWGDAHFVSLYLPTRTPFPDMEPYALDVGSVQYDWLINDLAQSAKPWKFVFMHSPMVSSSAHRYDDYDSNGELDRLEIQQILLPILKQYGVQAVFSGHDHNYERCVPTNGVHQFVSGGGGYSLYYMSARDTLSSQFWRTYHCLQVTIVGDTMQVAAVDETGAVFDTMVLQRAPPPPQVWASAWNPVRVETNAADDGDGNISGQSFNFSGTPIPAMAGDFSNLGELYVNNDPVFLHLGIKQCMLRDSDNVFLFIESPRLPGVTNLAGLGNGILDPDELGADGLDFLENLSFTNFSPAIACLVGDEFADGQYRSFSRPGLALNVGQGVFHLDTNFTDVPGVRLQQFNISPQWSYPGIHQGVEFEQNADLIEISIPYASLGGVHPGEQIRIGAVVGGSGFDLATQTRELDRGFCGTRLDGSGQAPVVLEGITVQLADFPHISDTDRDGLLDQWELAHTLDPLSAEGYSGGQGDPDGDGFTNLQEQSAGTDPRDPASALRVTVVKRTTDRFLVTWLTVPGRRYVLQWTANLGTPFSDWPDPTFPKTSLSGADSFEIDTSILNPQPDNLLLRVEVLAP